MDGIDTLLAGSVMPDTGLNQQGDIGRRVFARKGRDGAMATLEFAGLLILL